MKFDDPGSDHPVSSWFARHPVVSLIVMAASIAGGLYLGLTRYD